MNEISLLSQDTIDKIAAGEVVERPASIVKELVENAVDAGANAVTVEIKDGGTSLVRITDNGCGIPKEQVPVAYLRHATSKIRKVEDLLTAGTLGFRGEALSSIAAVCQVEMITKTAGSLTGVRYVIEGGVEKKLEEIGAPEGTTFLVHNLFYNTPARKKFLKTPATEAGYVNDLMERMALSHPEISFKFIANRDTKLHTSGNSNLRDIIYGIYGREIAANLVKVDADYGYLKITGFLGKPMISRGNRNYENYFVNGRYVKSAIVARAIEDGYKAFMMSHRYPFTVLMLQIDTEQVDVNVHPTKMEVRFANQQDIYEKVLQTVREGLLERELIPEITLDGTRQPSGAGKGQKAKPSAISGHGERLTSGERQTDPLASGSGQRDGLIPGGRQTNAPASGGRQQEAASAGAGERGVGEGFLQDRGERPSGAGIADKNISGAGSGISSASQPPRYPEPFEKIRSQLIAEANSPYSTRYPQRERPAMKPVTGSVLPGTDQALRQGAAQSASSTAETAAGQPQRTFGGADFPDGGNAKEIGKEPSPAASGENGLADERQRAAKEDGLSPETREQEDSPLDPALLETLRSDAARIREVQEDARALQMDLFENKLLDEENRPKHKLIGQVFATYWLVEFEDKLYIIDQHAAHEKVMYERFMKNYREKRQTSQMITPPVIVSLNLQEEELLKRHMDAFHDVGFEIEPFGGREYSIRAVPGNLYGLADRELFLDILDGLSDIPERASDQIVLEKIASMSCKAAVKGGDRLSLTEANALIQELLTLENPYNCPHGRPTIISMTKYEMEKKFKRIL